MPKIKSIQIDDNYFDVKRIDENNVIVNIRGKIKDDKNKPIALNKLNLYINKQLVESLTSDHNGNINNTKDYIIPISEGETINLQLEDVESKTKSDIIVIKEKTTNYNTSLSSYFVSELSQTNSQLYNKIKETIIQSIKSNPNYLQDYIINKELDENISLLFDNTLSFIHVLITDIFITKLLKLSS